MIDLTFDDTLFRVQIAISEFPNGAALIERSANQIAWQTVRGGTALPIVGGAGSLDDFDGYFASADGSLTTFYRVSSASLEDTVDVFTASDTWNKPVGLVAAKITVVGAGGGGGGAEATGAGEVSGGSGGTCGVVAVSVIPAATLGSSETVTIGAAGSGGVGASNGSSGGTSSFGAHVSAPGGAGGPHQAAASAPRASATATPTTGGTGQVLVPGHPGDPSLMMGSAVSSQVSGGLGGRSPFGAGGSGGSGADGGDGDGFGGGGGGCANQASVVARTGGDGAPGLVIVEHFFAGEGP